MKATKARLDPSGTAKGQTEIRAHHRASARVLPGIGAESYSILNRCPACYPRCAEDSEAPHTCEGGI